jgi:phage terminase large subunit-like protein
MAGLDLDPWQQYVLTESLGERADGRWACFEVGLIVPRQNGKGGILEARELAGLFLVDDDRLIIHSAHQYDTSMEAFERLLGLIEDTPALSKMVPARGGVIRSHGAEGIRLKNGKRIRFRTRTKGGGRGFTGDCIILDEAMVISRAMHGALMPTLSAVPNPQLWYTGSAVDEDVHEHGLVLAKVRERGMAGGDPKLGFFEWSVDPVRYEKDPKLASDPKAWAQANPALGIRISTDYVAAEQRSMYDRTFSVERLSIGRWPRTDEADGRVISAEAWEACADRRSQISGPVTFAVDVTPDRDGGTVAVAGARSDGLPHIEVIENETGTSWIVARCSDLKAKNRGARFVVDPKGPASTLIPELIAAGVDVHEVSTQEYARACGAFYDQVIETAVRYLPPQPELDTALGAATIRPMGDAWAWARRSTTDISPLVAATLALWGAQNLRVKRARVVDLGAALARDAQRKREAANAATPR